MKWNCLNGLQCKIQHNSIMLMAGASNSTVSAAFAVAVLPLPLPPLPNSAAGNVPVETIRFACSSCKSEFCL